MQLKYATKSKGNTRKNKLDFMKIKNFYQQDTIK